MDTTRFDAVTRLFDSGMTRRDALRHVMAGAAALTAGGALLTGEEATAGKKRRTSKRKKKERRSNVCDQRNWCVDRTQTCGPAGGYGKCLVKARGGHICGEILFQVPSCEECEEPNCTDCVCVLAAGGVDRCNNGANGYDYICVRPL